MIEFGECERRLLHIFKAEYNAVGVLQTYILLIIGAKVNDFCWIEWDVDMGDNYGGAVEPFKWYFVESEREKGKWWRSWGKKLIILIDNIVSTIINYY